MINYYCLDVYAYDWDISITPWTLYLLAGFHVKIEENLWEHSFLVEREWKIRNSLHLKPVLIRVPLASVKILCRIKSLVIE